MIQYHLTVIDVYKCNRNGWSIVSRITVKWQYCSCHPKRKYCIE